MEKNDDGTAIMEKNNNGWSRMSRLGTVRSGSSG
eukprot:COSAG04_NODE_5610_length_1553_cov_1.488308_3_plen_33_part_01